MDDDLARKLAAHIDVDEGRGRGGDPEVAAALRDSVQARSWYAGLRTVERTLRSLSAPARSEDQWEQFASQIDRVLDQPVVQRTNADGSEFDPLAPPRFADDPSLVATQSERPPMSEPNDNDNSNSSNEDDDDLAGLAALTRPSTPGPTRVSIPPPPIKPGPSLGEDGMGESSGIVDMKQLTEIANRQSAASAAAAATAASSPAGSATPAPSVTTPAQAVPAPTVAPASAQHKGPGTMVWLGPTLAILVVGGFFAWKQGMLGTVPATPTATAPSSVEANVPPSAPVAAPAAPSVVALPPQAAAPAAPLAPSAPETPAQPSVVAPAPAAPEPASAGGSTQDRRSARTSHSAGGGGGGGAEPAAPAAPAPAAAPVAATAPARATGAPGAPRTMDDLMATAVGRHPAGGAATAAANLGAAPAGAPGPAADLPQRLTRPQATAVMSPLLPAVRACVQGQTGTATVAMVIQNDGSVQTANVSGPFGAANACIAGVVRRAHFPRFVVPTMSMVYPFMILPPRPGAN